MSITGFNTPSQRRIMWIVSLTLAVSAVVWLGNWIIHSGRKEFTLSNRRLLYGPITHQCEDVGNATAGAARWIADVSSHWKSPKVLVFCDAGSWQRQLEALHRNYELQSPYVLDWDSTSVFFNAQALEPLNTLSKRQIVAGFAAFTLKSSNSSKISGLLASWERKADTSGTISLLLVMLVSIGTWERRAATSWR